MRWGRRTTTRTGSIRTVGTDARTGGRTGSRTSRSKGSVGGCGWTSSRRRGREASSTRSTTHRRTSSPRWTRDTLRHGKRTTPTTTRRRSRTARRNSRRGRWSNARSVWSGPLTHAPVHFRSDPPVLSLLSPGPVSGPTVPLGTEFRTEGSRRIVGKSLSSVRHPTRSSEVPSTVRGDLPRTYSEVPVFESSGPPTPPTLSRLGGYPTVQVPLVRDTRVVSTRSPM